MKMTEGILNVYQLSDEELISTLDPVSADYARKVNPRDVARTYLDQVRHGLSRVSYARREVAETDPETGDNVTVMRVVDVTDEVGLYPADQVGKDLGPMWPVR